MIGKIKKFLNFFFGPWAERNLVLALHTDVAMHKITHARLEAELAILRKRNADLEKILRERTEIDVDISPQARERNWCIAVGRFKGVDYVQTFELPSGSFDMVVNGLRALEKTAEVKRVDAPPPLRAVVKRGQR